MPAPALPPPPDGRFLVAFDAGAWVWDPAWTRLDDNPNLVTSYTIDRGRQFELDRTDAARATVEIIDKTGLLDPTNTSSPYHNKIEPLKQAMIGRHNPVTDEWHTRFRGWIGELDYSFHPSQRVNMLTLELVDSFDMLSAIELQPGRFGDQPPEIVESPDTIWMGYAATVRARLDNIVGVGNAGLPEEFFVFFSGNVEVFQTAYSSGETVLDVLQDAADAEFPGIGNLYTDRRGRCCFHGRFAKFDPIGVSDEAGPGRWEWTEWECGDGAAVAADPANTAHLRSFSFNRGLGRIINSASVSPQWVEFYGKEPTPNQLASNIVQDTASINQRGFRSWSMANLQTAKGQPSGANSVVETRKFATYYRDNYAVPQNRVTAISFRTMHPTWEGAAITWDLLSRVDVSDGLKVTVDSPGGGGFLLESYYIEGVHEEAKMLSPDYDDVTLSLDLSPRVYYADPAPL